jgi:LmbE family N-acetylglucosaminyl deacetylase
MKKHTIMGIFAHPDDETFGPGGTFAKYSARGHRTVVLTATSGQAGQASGLTVDTTIGEIRKKELRNATKLLGISRHIQLNFYDGTLNEFQIPLLQDYILHEVAKEKPDVIIVYEREGISLHLDHIAVTKAVIGLYDSDIISPKKIYYFGLPEEIIRFFGREGGLPDEKQAVIDISGCLEIKKKAMNAHKSQMKDVKRMLERYELANKQGKDFMTHEYFSLARTALKGLSFPEKDLLAGL